MGIIRDALIGIALYEAIAYVLKNKSDGFSEAGRSLEGSLGGTKSYAAGHLNVVRESESLPIEQSNAGVASGTSYDSSAGTQKDSGVNSPGSGDSLAAGSNPEIPLTGDGSVNDRKDAWTNSLANDEL
ncbi:MAG TPA: hypothetical protein VF679_04800, partial [Pedobacter sp.]